jgi:glutamine amidotransferase
MCPWICKRNSIDKGKIVKIGIIDYQLNNLQSVRKAFQRIGIEAVISSNADLLSESDRLVLPGVGAFGAAMENLRQLKLDDFIISSVRSGKPILGICLGMQLLFSKSHEHGTHTGLNLLEGDVERFPEEVKVPHIGWNQIECDPLLPLFTGIESGSYVYFVHSYYVSATVPSARARTEYGDFFASVVQQNSIVGFQFHPEKSQNVGLALLKNFAFNLPG